MEPRKLILRNHQCPGDIVMLTAAVRDLQASYPGEFQIDVRTPCAGLWEHNPHVTRIWDGDGEVIQMKYNLIHGCNGYPWHFIHGFRQHLEQVIERPIKQGPFKGDIHLSTAEKSWISQVEEKEGNGARFWIVVAGGKKDYTAKLWEHARWQHVINATPEIRWVQVGENGHIHPPLSGVLDLRGKTTLRQLVRLVHHADGVICPVTSLMHLAAAVPVRDGRPKLRPCVVVAGGREPAHWEAYPGHRYLDTVGALPCCATGGCWKSLVLPLEGKDNLDEHGKPKSVCAVPVKVGDGVSIPRCLEMITPHDVVRAIHSYPAECRTK